MKKKSLHPETLAGLASLEASLRDMEGLLVAFSGGVDSTFLLAVAAPLLKERCLAVTVETLFHEKEEVEDAARRAAAIGARHEILRLDLEVSGREALANPPDRCYHCKNIIFSALLARAREEGLAVVVDASHMDDLRQRRPGMKALKELGIRSPLLEAKLSKEEIRELSEHLGVKGARRPSRPCLATRIPYDTVITAAALRRVAWAEKILAGMSFEAPRVRDYGDLARVEILAAEMDRLADRNLRDEIDRSLRDVGYTYVTVDLAGYRSGSMDETLPD